MYPFNVMQIRDGYEWWKIYFMSKLIFRWGGSIVDSVILFHLNYLTVHNLCMMIYNVLLILQEVIIQKLIWFYQGDSPPVKPFKCLT